MSEMTAICQNIDDAVTVHLRREGQTQSELASQMELSEVQFSRKRRGDAKWTLNEYVRLCKLIGKDPRYLFTT